MIKYTTSAGVTSTPVEIELWTPAGERLGYLGDYMEATFTWADRAPDTASLTLPLNALTASLVPMDGSVLIGARLGDQTHLSVPVEVKVEAVKDSPGRAAVQVTSAGGWGLFSGARIPPSLEDPVIQQTGDEYQLHGPLDAVAKRLVTLAATRLDLPVLVAPVAGEGPDVNITGAWEAVGEVLETAMATSGYHLQVRSWLPGDPVPDWLVTPPARPCVLVDLVPYRQRPGLVWSVEGGDLKDWTLTTTRAKATRVTVGYETDKLETRHYQEYIREAGITAWARREDYVKFDYKPPVWADKDAEPDPIRVYEAMDQAGDKALTEGAANFDLQAEVEVSNLWTFSRDSNAARTFNVGDLVQVSLPYLGTLTRTITAVEAKVDDSGFTVTPTVASPDTPDRDMFTALATLDRRVGNIERGK